MTILCFVGLFVLSWGIEATSLHIEANRNGHIINPKEPWLREFASHAVWIILVLLTPMVIDRFLSRSGFVRQSLRVLLPALLVFSIIHVVGMVTIRKLTYPMFLGHDYTFGLSDPLNWIYEVRKDGFTFILIVAGFVLGREASRKRVDWQAAQTQAKTDRRISLKSGGRRMVVNSDEVLFAKAAGNYVEVNTDSGNFLARLTLSHLEILLQTAGADIVRLHRSALVRSDAIRELRPNGKGGWDVVTPAGDRLPVSRKYVEQVRRSVTPADLGA